MPREFQLQLYGNNSREDIIAAQQAKAETQNKLAQSGGEAIPVVQFETTGSDLSPHNTNNSIKQLSHTLLRADELTKVQGNTGQPIGGSRRYRKYRRSRKRNRNRRRNRKSRKY
jgi:hypothetical protein